MKNVLTQVLIFIIIIGYNFSIAQQKNTYSTIDTFSTAIPDKTCGVLCLENILKTIKPETHLEDIASISYNPISIHYLLELTKQYFENAQCCNLSFSDLPSIKKPAILHLKQEHYIVLHNIENNKYRIYDPLFGYLTYSEEMLSAKWTGYIITLDKIKNINTNIPKSEKLRLSQKGQPFLFIK